MGLGVYESSGGGAKPTTGGAKCPPAGGTHGQVQRYGIELAACRDKPPAKLQSKFQSVSTSFYDISTLLHSIVPLLALLTSTLSPNFGCLLVHNVTGA